MTYLHPQTVRVFVAVLLLTTVYSFTTFMLIDPAFAQSVVDIRPTATAVLDWVAMAAGAVFTTLGAFAIRLVSSKVGLANSELEQSLNMRLQEFIKRGIKYGYDVALAEINDPENGMDHLQIRSWVIALAVNYTNNSAPEIIKRFNLSQDRIEEMVKAQLPGVLGVPPGVPVA